MTIQKTAISNLLPVLGVSISLASGTILLSWMLFYLTGNTSYYLLSFIAIVASALYKSIRAGWLTTILTTLAINFLFLPPHNSFFIDKFSSLIDLMIFFFCSIIIITIINRIKNTKEVMTYRQKEKEYLEQIERLHKQTLHQQKEIKSRDEFLSIASHELKTPLSAMLLQIQTALHNIRTVSLANFSVEKLLKMLQGTEQQSKRLSKMINDLLNVSLIRTGRMELEKEQADLGQLVQEVTDRFSEKAEREGSPIYVEIKEKVIGNFDRLRIEQALINLISNAIKYGNHEPIEVRVKRKGNVGVITIADNGIGIPEDRHKRIFERFERAVSSQNYKGLGVGLYITQHIITTHNGNIRLQSKPNMGSTFTIELPLLEAAKQAAIPASPTLSA